MILSINEGLFLYYGNKSFMYPFIRTNLKNRWIKPNLNSNEFLKIFSSYLFLGTTCTTILYPELTDYIGTCSEDILIGIVMLPFEELL